MDDSWGLTRMTRVEVVIGGEDVAVVSSLISDVGATGFTVVPNVSGLGHGGFHQGRLLFNDRDGLALVTVVLPDGKCGALLDGLRRLLERRSGVLLVSDTWVSRPGYFDSPT